MVFYSVSLGGQHECMSNWSVAWDFEVSPLPVGANGMPSTLKKMWTVTAWGESLKVCIVSTHPFFFAAVACNPSACRAVGRGLQPKGVRVKETADFKVYTKGAGSGELKVIVKGPSKYFFLK